MAGDDRSFHIWLPRSRRSDCLDHDEAAIVPRRLLERVSSLDWFISIGLVPVPFALTVPAAAYLGATASLVGAGVLGAAATLAFLFLPNHARPPRELSLSSRSRLVDHRLS